MGLWVATEAVLFLVLDELLLEVLGLISVSSAPTYTGWLDAHAL